MEIQRKNSTSKLTKASFRCSCFFSNASPHFADLDIEITLGTDRREKLLESCVIIEDNKQKGVYVTKTYL